MEYLGSYAHLINGCSSYMPFVEEKKSASKRKDYWTDDIWLYGTVLLYVALCIIFCSLLCLFNSNISYIPLPSLHSTSLQGISYAIYTCHSCFLSNSVLFYCFMYSTVFEGNIHTARSTHCMAYLLYIMHRIVIQSILYIFRCMFHIKAEFARMPWNYASICTSGWTEKHHQRKLQRVNHHVSK